MLQIMVNLCVGPWNGAVPVGVPQESLLAGEKAVASDEKRVSKGKPRWWEARVFATGHSSLASGLVFSPAGKLLRHEKPRAVPGSLV